MDSLYSALPAMDLLVLLHENGIESNEVKQEQHSLGGRKRVSFQCTQRAGDVMFVPTLWAHATFNMKQSIGVAHEFSTESFCMQ